MIAQIDKLNSETLMLLPLKPVTSRELIKGLIDKHISLTVIILLYRKLGGKI